MRPTIAGTEPAAPTQWIARGARYLLLAAALLAAGCERDGEIQIVDTRLEVSDPDSFLRFFNTQASLPAGHYTLVVGTSAAGVAGNFSLTITRDDGSVHALAGAWTASAGQDPADSANPGFSVELQRAGGLVVSAESAAAVCLYLLRDPADSAPDPDLRTGQEFAPGDGSCRDTLDLPASRISSRQYSQAYYDTIDPNRTRRTLADWRATNEIDQIHDAHVQFRDTRDLGYGRNMFFRVKPNGTFAAFVDNFQVRDIPGLAYTDLNLDALVRDDRRHHIGSNAIEYSCADPNPANCDCNAAPRSCFVKFFTFLPAGAGGEQVLTFTQDLDGRGEKPMPGICITCHGGDTLPLLPDGSFPNGGDTNSKLQILEVDSFEFDLRAQFSRATFEPGLKALNKAVYCTYPGADPGVCAGPETPTPPTPAAGEWPGYLALDVVEGCYGAGFTESTYGGSDGECDYVPPGWIPDPGTGSPPAGADELYRQVIGPHCVVCHARRGSNLGSGGTDSFGANAMFGGGDDDPEQAKDIDFSSWEKFISHADQIERLVYDEGKMPAALLNFRVFWSDPNKPALLGSFLPGFTHGNADGTARAPGDPVARPGPSRTTTVPVRITAAASLFATDYAWSLVSGPAGAAAGIADPAAIRTTFDTDLDGEYRLRLTARNGAREDTAELVLTVDSGLSPAPESLTFDTDIRAILQPGCTGGCHENGGIDGIPVWWTDAQQVMGQTLYQSVLSRVDLADPENSLILRKPTGNHHNGGCRPGFDIDDNPTCPDQTRQNYDTLLRWILAGARRD